MLPALSCLPSLALPIPTPTSPHLIYIYLIYIFLIYIYRYAEMEMRHRFVNHARNVWDRAVTLLPRIDQLW